MKGQDIFLCGLGRRIEGTISGTPKPGTMMQIKTATEPVNGRHTYEIYSPITGGSPSLTGDGAPGLPLILDIDGEQGMTNDSAYVSGTRCFLWVLLPGDEVNVRKADISGTGSAVEDLAIGDRLLIVQATGMVSKIAVGIVASPVQYVFQALETITDQPAEALVHCMRL